MSFETRTRWIPIADLTTEHDLAGFGPVETITRSDGRVRVSNTYGACREYSDRTDVQLYEGVFDTDTGRKISMSTEDYREAIRADLSRR